MKMRFEEPSHHATKKPQEYRRALYLQVLQVLVLVYISCMCFCFTRVSVLYLILTLTPPPV